MYEAQSEFPEGWGGGDLEKFPSLGGMDIFWNYTLWFHVLFNIQSHDYINVLCLTNCKFARINKISFFLISIAYKKDETE